MSLELLNTVATLATCVVVATTAIAALIQLRHLRASNQIEGQLAINALIQSAEFRDAMMTLRDLDKMLADPVVAREFTRPLTRATPPNIVEMVLAARTVGSNLENVGNMIRNGLTDGRLFVEQFGNVVTDAWDLLEPLTRIRRRYNEDHDAVWEDFEQLTILSRDWIAKVGSAYPANTRRLLPPWTELPDVGDASSRAPERDAPV